MDLKNKKVFPFPSGIIAVLFIFSSVMATDTSALIQKGEVDVIFFVQAPVEPEPEEEKGFVFRPFREYPSGSRIVALSPLSPNGKVENLTSDFAAAGAPEVSYDGKRILFSGKRTEESHWEIWEMNLDGSEVRQITKGLGDCTDPAYLSRASITPPLFADEVRWIVFASTAPGTYDEHGRDIATSLYVCNIEPIEGRGTVVWRTTFNLSGDFSPTVLQDGRVLFTSWQHHGNRYYPNGLFALMTVNWSGTGLNPFYGNHEGPLVKTMAREFPNRTVVFVESDGSSYDGSGQLAAVSLKRPLHSRRVLSRGDGRYRSPYPLPDGRMIVSYAPGSREGTYGIYYFDLKKGKPGKRIYDDPKWHEFDAAAVYPRPEPMGRIPIVDDRKSTGYLYCLNSYESDRPEAGDIQPGEIKKVRLVEGIGLSGPGPTSKGATSFVQTRIIGEAPVEEDGSFYLEVPSDTPFYIQTLDENGIALQTMRSWIWVRKGSRRGCIGCHEDKELAPENRAPDAIRKAEPVRLVSPPEERRAVDFRRDVMPIITERCAKCHPPAGGLDLGREQGASFNRAYESLLQLSPGKPLDVGGKYVHPGSARNSPLVWLLYGKRLGSQYKNTPYNKPIKREHPEEEPLTDAEKRVFAEWIDLGAQWDNILGTDE